jgi:hypothetical protein
MQRSDIFSVVFLCIINIIFMVAGIFLNSVVIISLWRSSQLRKKPCYFMILVLSCFDLAVVTISHPLLIASTIYFSQGEIDNIRGGVRTSIVYVLCSSSLSALFTLNVERFLALTRPFFHQVLVTKTRLLCFQAFCTVTIIGISPLVYLDLETIVDISACVFISSLLFLFIYSNYTIFIIAKSKRADERVATTTAMDENRKTRILNLKSISTCSLAVGCFFCCFCTHIIYLVLRLASRTSLSDTQFLSFFLWSSTFISFNSTFNCVIFFWRNSILRREGVKTVNAFRRRVTN